MNKIKVLVIDDNELFVDNIKKYFSSHAVIEVVDAVYNGKDGLSLLERKEYNLVLLDLVLREMDGITLLEELIKREISTRIIVITSFSSPEIIRKVSSFGIKYYLLKPFDLEILENKIIEYANEELSDYKVIDLYYSTIQLSIIKLLHELGVPSNIKGYTFIKEGIYLIYKDPSLSNTITKRLYPEIAKKYHTTASCVERAIRHAIEISWNRANINLMEEVFGYSIDIEKAKATNSEFIVTLADKLRLDNYLNI